MKKNNQFSNSLKKYKAVSLIEINNQSFIKKGISKNETLFYQKVKNNQNILQPTKIDKQIAYFTFYPNSEVFNESKTFFLKIFEEIAKFHHYSKNYDLSFLPKNSIIKYKKDLDKTLNLFQKYKISLSPKIKKVLSNSLENIKINTIIHGDFIALNVLKVNNQPKFIDWEGSIFDFAEKDPGRFLADLFFSENKGYKPKWNKRYYPIKWHDELQEKYLLTREKLNKNYDVKKGKQRIFYGEIWNYMGPLEMSLFGGESKTPWFEENLKALNKIVENS